MATKRNAFFDDGDDDPRHVRSRQDVNVFEQPEVLEFMYQHGYDGVDDPEYAEQWAAANGLALLIFDRFRSVASEAEMGALLDRFLQGEFDPQPVPEPIPVSIPAPAPPAMSPWSQMPLPGGSLPPRIPSYLESTASASASSSFWPPAAPAPVVEQPEPEPQQQPQQQFGYVFPSSSTSSAVSLEEQLPELFANRRTNPTTASPLSQPFMPPPQPRKRQRSSGGAESSATTQRRRQHARTTSSPIDLLSSLYRRSPISEVATPTGLQYFDQRSSTEVTPEEAKEIEMQHQRQTSEASDQLDAMNKKRYGPCQDNEEAAAPVTITPREAEQFELWKTQHDINNENIEAAMHNTFLRMTPRDYQKAGALWLFKLYQHAWDRDERSFGAVLGDDVGTGKTLQVCLFLLMARLRSVIRERFAENVLIIVPERKHVEDWRATLTVVFNNADPTFVVEGGRQRGRLPEGKIVLVHRSAIETWKLSTTTEGLVMPQLFNQDRRWHCVVVDEAHGMRNGAQYYQNIKALSPSLFRVALTATALVNDVPDLLCLFNWTVPGLLLGHGAIHNPTVESIKEVVKPLFLHRAAQTRWRTHCYYIRFPPTPEQQIEYEKNVAYLAENPNMHFTFRRRMNIGNVFPGYPFERKLSFEPSGEHFVFKPLIKKKVVNGDGAGIQDAQGIDRTNTPADTAAARERGADMTVHVESDNRDEWVYIHRDELQRMAEMVRNGATTVTIHTAMSRQGLRLGTLEARGGDGSGSGGTLELNVNMCVSSSFSFVSLHTFLTSLEMNIDLSRERIINSIVSKSSKLMSIFHISREIMKYKRDRMLIYTSFVPVVDIVYEFLAALYGKSKVHQITGRVDQRVRRQRMDEFNSSQSELKFLVSTFAVGAEGFNIQRANHVLFVDTPWTYAAIMQAAGRVQRLNQKRDHVYIYSLQTTLLHEKDAIRKVALKRKAHDTIHQSGSGPRDESIYNPFSDEDDLDLADMLRGAVDLSSTHDWDPAHDEGCTDNSCLWKVVRQADQIPRLRKPESKPFFDEQNDHTHDDAPGGQAMLQRLARMNRHEQQEMLRSAARHRRTRPLSDIVDLSAMAGADPIDPTEDDPSPPPSPPSSPIAHPSAARSSVPASVFAPAPVAARAPVPAPAPAVGDVRRRNFIAAGNRQHQPFGSGGL